MRLRPGGMSGRPSSGASPDACARRWRSVEPGGPAGSSSSTVPSSSATSSATPVSSFVTDAQRSSTSRGPCTPISSVARVTPAAAVRAPHSSMIRNASTAGDTRSVDRRVISSGSSLEERWGYSRAVVVGNRVLVAGTAPIMPGDADPPPEPYEQARSEEHTSELQSLAYLVCRLLLEKKKKNRQTVHTYRKKKKNKTNRQRTLN